MSKLLKTSLIGMLALPLCAHAVVLSGVTVIDSSTAFSGAYAASNAVDGNSSEYASLGAGPSTFLTFSLGGSAQSFDHIVVVNRDSGSANDLISSFTVTPGGGSGVAISTAGLRGASDVYSMGRLVTTTTVNLQVNSVVGSGTAGNVGVQDVYLLRTPLNSAAVAGVSVISAAPAYSGGGNYVAAKTVDGIIGRSNGTESAEYASGDGTNIFVDFNLGSLKSVTGFDFFDRPASVDRTTGFDLIFSQDAVFGNGDDIVRSYTNSTSAMSDEFAGISAQYVRYDVTATTAGFAGMSEITFYAAVPEPSAALLLSLAAAPLLARRRRL